MKKIIIILFAVLILFILPSCTIREGEVKDRVLAPLNNTPPILGKWVIEGPAKVTSNENTEEDIYIGTEALFHKDAVIIGNNYTDYPSFKVKNVNSIDYLLYKYKTSPNTLGITSEKVQVITVLNDKNYFYEFIKSEDGYLYVNLDDNFYKMKKVVDEVSLEEISRYINVEKSMMRSFGVVEEENLQTGILLGIKIPSYDEENDAPSWEYKTIWINSQNKRLAGVYELNELLVPRKNGFWIIESLRESVNGSVRDNLVAIPQFKLSEGVTILDEFDLAIAQDDSILMERKVPSIIKNILFIGNDFISVENIDLDRNHRKTLQVYAIDNLEDKKPIKLTDLIGETGSDLFYEGATSVLNLDQSMVINEENVGLIRRNGYWVLRGRVNYRQNEEELSKDFNIKAIPPKDMVSYDELSIPWDAIRIMVPDVVDVFISPNNEFMVVMTSSHLVVYSIEDGDIVNTPIAKIKLPFDSRVIMSEWAVGRYTNIWQNEVIKNEGIKIDY